MKPNYLGDPSLSPELVSTFGGKAQKLHELLMAGFSVPKGFVLTELPKDSSSLLEGIEKIGGFPVAVRSSGALEDLEGASFAGLYETYLFINSPAELEKAVHDCFESRNSHRVKDYLNTKGIAWTPDSLKMSVLVQKMVDAKTAGVLFTLNPINGFEEEMYVEFCEGVGERLVSGHVTPSRLRYNWRTSETVTLDINNENTTLDEAHLLQLVREGLRIQAFYHHPQDIEWGIDKSDKLFILQSRPVTSYSPREDRPELTNADLKDGGISARVCTPTMFSSYRDALQLSMGNYFKAIKLIPNDEHITWIYSHYGRVYWNAGAVKEGMKKVPDFREQDFDQDLGIQKDYGVKGPFHVPLTVGTVVGVLPTLIALGREFDDCMTMVEQFRERFELQDAKLKRDVHSLRALDESAFKSWMLTMFLFQQETERNYFRTIYNNANYQSEFKGYLKKLKGYEAGDEVDLMGELHGVSHLDVQGGLKDLHEGSSNIGEFLAVHYHHGPAELDITVPRWGENVAWVEDLVKSYVPVKATTKSPFKETSGKISSGLHFVQRSGFAKKLKKSRDFLRVREEMRSYSTRAYYLLRLGLLEFAKRLGLEGNQIFMLELHELKHKLLHPESKLPDIATRELLYRAYRDFKAPNEFGGAIQAHGLSSSGLKGLGCSPGVFEGTARVIFDIHQTLELTKDDILITPFTDPGWTPVLARVGGVVTEVGGLLSHAAVIGREYGIPAILNLINATKTIKDGERIRMNGKTGVVEIL
jgi:phosphohistidine swiveling domain-containing protein